MESIKHLRHHPRTGILHYRRVVPPELRTIIGRGTISATLGSKVLDHDALQRWIEIDRDAQQRLADARRKLSDQRRTEPVTDDQINFVDIRSCREALMRWQQREIGHHSIRLYGLFAHDDVAPRLEAFAAELTGLRASTEAGGLRAYDSIIHEALQAAGISVSNDHPALPALRWIMTVAERRMNVQDIVAEARGAREKGRGKPPLNRRKMVGLPRRDVQVRSDA